MTAIKALKPNSKIDNKHLENSDESGNMIRVPIDRADSHGKAWVAGFSQHFSIFVSKVIGK